MSTTNPRARLKRRLTLDVALSVGAASPSLHGRSSDLSEQGIFVVTRDHLPEGRRVDITITGPDVETPIVTSGVVVHQVAGLGVGLKFTEAHPRTRERIGAAVVRIKKSA